MSGGGELGHVHADLGDDALSGAFADSGDGVQPVASLSKRGDQIINAGVQDADRVFQMVQVLQRQPYQQGVMGAKPAVQRLPQLPQLAAQPTLGQLGQHPQGPAHR